jgi:hypothetical protein
MVSPLVLSEIAQNIFPARPQAKKTPQAYPPGYVEEVFKPRTKLVAVFISLHKNKKPPSLHPGTEAQ